MSDLSNFLKKFSPKEQETPQSMEDNEIPSMKPQHEHQFELFLKTFAPPRADWEGKIANTTEKIVEKLLFGVTTLLFKCVLCTETKKEEVLGSDEQQLDEIFEKVEKFGPQYVQRDGITYAIGKLQQQGVVPVR